MATPLQPSTPDSSTVRRRRGPRYEAASENHRAGAGLIRDQVSLDEFRSHTKGVSTRLGMPSVEAMRAGTVLSPHALCRRYLMSGRALGLGKEWAVRFALFVSRQADMLWPMEPTATAELERRAMVHEGADDLAELAHHTTRCRPSKRQRRDTLAKEIAADQILLARLDRELEEQAR